jgi:hypothetical protein
MWVKNRKETMKGLLVTLPFIAQSAHPALFVAQNTGTTRFV